MRWFPFPALILTFLAALDCITPQPTVALAIASSPLTPPVTIQKRGHVANDPCVGRSRCEIIRRRPIEKAGEIVDVAIKKGTDGGEDECNLREYWFFANNGGRKPTLLAIDCDIQRSAEGPGVADTRVSGSQFSVSYLEFQASDYCERYEAKVTLLPFSISSQNRWEGESGPRGCKIKRRIKKLAPLGTGEPGHPVLRLHVEWADLHGGS